MSLLETNKKHYLIALILSLIVFFPISFFMFQSVEQPCRNYVFTFGTETITPYTDTVNDMYGYVRQSNLLTSDTVYLGEETFEMVEIHKLNNPNFAFSITNCNIGGVVYYKNDFQWR